MRILRHPAKRGRKGVGASLDSVDWKNPSNPMDFVDNIGFHGFFFRKFPKLDIHGWIWNSGEWIGLDWIAKIDPSPNSSCDVRLTL